MKKLINGEMMSTIKARIPELIRNNNWSDYNAEDVLRDSHDIIFAKGNSFTIENDYGLEMHIDSYDNHNHRYTIAELSNICNKIGVNDYQLNQQDEEYAGGWLFIPKGAIMTCTGKTTTRDFTDKRDDVEFTCNLIPGAIFYGAPWYNGLEDISNYITNYDNVINEINDYIQEMM